LEEEGGGLQTPHEPEGTPYIYTYYEHIIIVSVLSPVLSLLNIVIEYSSASVQGESKSSHPLRFSGIVF